MDKRGMQEKLGSVAVQSECKISQLLKAHGNASGTGLRLGRTRRNLLSAAIHTTFTTHGK